MTTIAIKSSPSRRLLFAALALGYAASTWMALAPSQALAQATCRNKCNAEEQACLKRTSNKSQCGSRAQSCAAKCK